MHRTALTITVITKMRSDKKSSFHPSLLISDTDFIARQNSCNTLLGIDTCLDFGRQYRGKGQVQPKGKYNQSYSIF
jgi:hypothetical protein